MHRTQIEKKKNNSKDFSVFFFLFLLFSQLDMWDETWVQSKQPEIIQQYQRMMADKLQLHLRGQDNCEAIPGLLAVTQAAKTQSTAPG
jgi:hypothetical protein